MRLSKKLSVLGGLALLCAPEIGLMDVMGGSSAQAQPCIFGFLPCTGGGFNALSGYVQTTLFFGAQTVFMAAAMLMFLYYGLKAVQLTEMANRVWKRSAEYGLILAERRRLGRGSVATLSGSRG